MIVEKVAELLYASDSPLPVEWYQALPEDRLLYLSTAEVVIDLIVQYLEFEDRDNYDGGLRLAIQLLTNDAEVSRLRRSEARV
jgi:hypothetical protein